VHKNPGLRVVAAATGINLALGILYSWSIFSAAIKQSILDLDGHGFHWDLSSVNDPYALACLVFAFCMIPAGRMQDRLGPRLTALTGGVLVSLGFVLISQTQDYWLWLLGFGGLVGAGIAFGYSAATPAALKWFPPAKAGLIAGIVVSGFGIAPAYIAPLGTWLVQSQGLLATMLILGLAFLVVVSLLSMQLVPPTEAAAQPAKALVSEDQHLLRQGRFWLLWVLYFIGAGAGLMVIGNISGMAKASMGELAFVAVAILALGNAAGRIILGRLADRFGYSRTLMAAFLLQAMLMCIAALTIEKAGPVVVVVLATFIGFNYGANLAIFPGITKALWGMPRFGLNYGFLFTAWGVGGFVMVKLSAWLGCFIKSFWTAGAFLAVGAVLALILHHQKQKLA
jgi:nitrate/nitrite transporter NarK